MPISRLTDSVRRMLPEKASLATGKISSLQKPLVEAELVQTRGMGLHRQREFIAGRASAKEAMLSLGMHDQVVLRDSFGCPLWPTSIVGSISHKGGLCGALVASSCSYVSAGFDIEFVEPLDRSVWSTFTTEEELKCCAIKKVSDENLANILFCAKEACFKALFPIFQLTTPSLQSISPIIKSIENQLVISLVEGHFHLSGGLVWDNRAIIAWVLATKKV